MRAFLLLGLTAGMLAAAPVPKEVADKPRAWKPTAGTRMVHVFGTADTERSIRDVTAGADGYTFSIVSEQRPTGWRLRVGPKVTTDVTNAKDLGTEVGYYRPGLKVGDTFDAPSEIGGPASHTVQVEEDVSVPAGKYKALRIRVATDRDARTYWLSYDVGVVRIADANGRSMMELKSYTPGK